VGPSRPTKLPHPSAHTHDRTVATTGAVQGRRGAARCDAAPEPMSPAGSLAHPPPRHISANARALMVPWELGRLASRFQTCGMDDTQKRTVASPVDRLHIGTRRIGTQAEASGPQLRNAREASATTRPRHTCSDHRAGRDDGVVNHRPKEDVMESAPLVDCAGRPRSPATLPGYHRGRPPRNKGSCRRRHEPFYADRAGMPTSA
jgi:hypothetical protein